MADLTQAAAIGVEIEKLNASVYPQFNQDSKFYSRLQNMENFKVSERLVRIPILAQPGSTFAQFVPDGTSDSMGTGGGEQYDAGVCSPVFFCQACQVTKGAEWSTDGKERSVVDVYKDSFRFNLKQFRTNIEALMATSDGSGVLGTVSVTPISAQNYIQVSNANDFQAGATYQVLASGLGTNRGNINILTCDLINNILYLNLVSGVYWPTGTVATDVLMVAGAPGTATITYAPDRYTSATVAASLNGVPAINYQSSAGSWFGIPRSTWPGVLNSAYVNGSTDAIVPQMFQLLESLLQRANGSDADELTDFVVHCNVDQVTAWENLGLYNAPATIYGSGAGWTAHTQGSGSGDADKKGRSDFLQKDRLKTMAGHELIVNIKARQQRIDCINFKYWFKTEVKPPSLFDVGGMTTFPLYGSDGGVAPTTAFYFVMGGQIANCKPRAGAYIDNLALPFGF